MHATGFVSDLIDRFIDVLSGSADNDHRNGGNGVDNDCKLERTIVRYMASVNASLSDANALSIVLAIIMRRRKDLICCWLSY